MTIDIMTLGLNIESPIVNTKANNFRPPTWPPARDFPVVIDANGVVISRYGDAEWNLWPWSDNKTAVINFGDGPQRRGDPSISVENADLLRQIVAWWMYGPRSVQTAATLVSRCIHIRPIFILCSREGIKATQLMEHPEVADKLPFEIYPASSSKILSFLHSINEQRSQLGFTLLTREGLRRLEASLPDHSRQQTPYIPARIWSYQVNRLRYFLEDFIKHRDKIEKCYKFCLESYFHNFGSQEAAFTRDHRMTHRRPFSLNGELTGLHNGATYYGLFSYTAKKYGIFELLNRWIIQDGEHMDDPGRGVGTLSSYLSLASYVGIAYLLNFTMMRINEAWTLHCDCLQIEEDEKFGPIYLIQGETTKTQKDNDARWVASSSAVISIDVLTCVARLRIVAAIANPVSTATKEDLKNPPIILRRFEPWAGSRNSHMPLYIRPQYPSYGDVIGDYPKLFDEGTLRITEDDLVIARQITTNLRSDQFSVGKAWPLAWHQLRRTGAVNMMASGLVSDSSVQYQFKHAVRAMSLYYGNGYSRLRLNDSVQSEYIRTMYEVMSKELMAVSGDAFVSPYGAERKSDILKLVKKSDVKKLAQAAKSGSISWRETLLGGCTKAGHCEYGGIDNVIRCGGGDGNAPCLYAIFDKRKEPAIRSLGKLISSRLAHSTDNSPDHESLKAQGLAIENVLNVIGR